MISMIVIHFKNIWYSTSIHHVSAAMTVSSVVLAVYILLFLRDFQFQFISFTFKIKFTKKKNKKNKKITFRMKERNTE